MRLTKKAIGFILILGGLVRAYFRRDIISRIIERGFSEAPLMDLFIPFVAIAIGIIILLSAYKKKKQ